MKAVEKRLEIQPDNPISFTHGDIVLVRVPEEDRGNSIYHDVYNVQDCLSCRSSETLL
jgi:hypothetical protein